MIRLLPLLLLLLLPPPAAGTGFSKSNAGTSGGEFLKFGADARGVAMGGEVSAASEDAAAIYWNPAGLARLTQRHGTFTGGILYQDVKYGFAAYAHPIKPLIPTRRREIRPSVRGTLAVAGLYLNAGTLKARDNQGEDTDGSFTPRDAAFIAGWGASFSESIDIGLTLKYIDSRIQAVARTGTMDLGARYNGQFFDWPYIFALNARNVGGQLRFRQQADPLPTSFRVGQSLRLTELWLLSLDVVMPRDNNIYAAAGTEVRIPVDERFETFIRGGWSGRTNSGALEGMAGFSFGLGLGYRSFVFDYAWLPYGVLGHTQRLTLAYRF
ncbi:MAG: PorV/PorQ family protein [Elusimicrobiota bacterium]